MGRNKPFYVDHDMDKSVNSHPARSKKEEKRKRKQWEEDDWDGVDSFDEYEDDLLDRL